MTNQYITSLHLNNSLTSEIIELVNSLVKLSYLDEVLLKHACVKSNLLEENFILGDKIPWETLVNDLLITLASHFKLNEIDIPKFPDRLILINDLIDKEEVIGIDSQLEKINKFLNKIIYPYTVPRFVFWHINSLNEFSKLDNCDFVGGKSKSLIEIVSQSKYDYTSEFVSRLQNFLNRSK